MGDIPSIATLGLVQPNHICQWKRHFPYYYYNNFNQHIWLVDFPWPAKIAKGHKLKFGRLMVAFPSVNPCLICLVSDGNKTVQTRESNKILPVNLDWEVSHFISFAIKLIIFHMPSAAETRVCLWGIWVTDDWNPEITLAVGYATLILTSIAAFSFKFQSRRFFNFQSPRKFISLWMYISPK